MILNPEDCIFLSHLLELASDVFSRHSCNDIDKNILNQLSKEKKDSLYAEIKEMGILDNDFLNENPEFDSFESVIDDWVWMEFYAQKMKGLI